MTKEQYFGEVNQFKKLAGLLKEGKAYGGVDDIPDMEFTLDGKDYIAKLEVDYSFNYDHEDGVYDYDQEVRVLELGVAEPGDSEYVPVTDPAVIKNIQHVLNTDPKLSQSIEDMVDTWDAGEAYDDADEYFDDGDYDEFREGDDYDMGTPSGDTDAMGNIAEDMGFNSFKSIDQVIDLLAFLGDYMQDRADSGEESDELGNYSMNKEAEFSSKIDDAIEYLQGLGKNRNVSEDIKKKFSVGDKVKYKGSDWEIVRASGDGFSFRLKSPEGVLSNIVTVMDLRDENQESEEEGGDSTISRGEKIALARGLDLLTNEQMIGLYLKALENYEEEPGKYLNMIPGLENWGSRDNEGRFKISASRLGKALGVESPNTSIRTVNKYVNILKGEESKEEELLYPKILKAAEKLKKRNPRDLAAIVNNAIVDTPIPAMKKRGRPGLPSDLGRRVDVVVNGLVNQAGFEWDRARKSAISKIAKEVGADESKVAAAYQEYSRLKRK